MRSYTEVSDELGSEKTSEEFVQRMANHLHACHRVLKDEGSFFLNLGDTFVNKDLQNIPHRVVIELQKKGWILRNTIIWKKTNKLPATSKDNLTCSYEFIFHLVKSKDYYFNPVLVPNQSASKKGVNIIKLKDAKFNESNFGHICINGLSEGKRLEDFWTEDTVMTAGVNQKVNQKYGIFDHPAPYPIDICILPILQTSRPGDVVLDIFSGSGTTGEAALLLGRKYIAYEFNPNFNEGQKGRLDDAIKKYNQSQFPALLPNDLRQAA
jgi:site-specific DNA-methyltransferase (adenine-specific)